MKRSINEIQGMVLKAARGAGVPLGLGEDLSDSVPFFISDNGLEGVVHLVGGGCQQALGIIDDLAAGEAEAALPADVPARAMICLAAARGICLGEVSGKVQVQSGTPIQAATGPQEVPEALWQKLEHWAAKTYVPATEASRIAGAGAGLTDND